MRSDFLRALYATMLLEMPAASIRQFWRKTPLELDGKELNEAELFRYLWKPNDDTTQAYLFEILESLEPFLMEKGLGIQEFSDKMILQINGGSILPGNIMLSIVNPVLQMLFQTLDPRIMVMKVLPLVFKKHSPEWDYKVIKTETTGAWTTVCTLLSTDSTFQDPCGALSFDLFYLKIGKMAPRMFGLPPFEHVSMLSDCRPVDKVMWLDNFAFREETFWIENEEFGTVTDFASFADRHGFDLSKYQLPRRTVVEMSRDYYCPRRKRVVLYKGCAYGGPIYIMERRFRKLPKGSRNYLFHMIGEVVDDSSKPLQSVTQLHRDLLKTVEERAVFVYHRRDEIITLNDMRLIKNVPAKILRRILATYSSEKRTRFEFWEFKLDQDITFDPKHSNFEVRLDRLAEKLIEKCPQLRLEKIARGVFSLHADCQVEFREEE